MEDGYEEEEKVAWYQQIVNMVYYFCDTEKFPVFIFSLWRQRM